MATMIRIFQNDKITDIVFSGKAIFRIGGTDTDDFKLSPMLKKFR